MHGWVRRDRAVQDALIEQRIQAGRRWLVADEDLLPHQALCHIGFDHLINILLGQPEKNIKTPGNSPLEAYFENLLRAEVGPMREEVAELAKAVNGMGKQIDVLFQRQTGSDTGKG